MNYQPLVGRCLVRKIATEETVPNGRIILTPAVQEAMVYQQAELVAVGPQEHPDDLEERNEESHWPELQLLEPGAWLLLKHRTWVETDQPDLYVVNHRDIIATVQEG